MSRFVEVPGGKIAYDVTGDGPLVICVPGLGDLRAEYRLLASVLVGAGFRVATLDLRGHGESSTGFDDYRASAVGADVVELAHTLGAQSFSIIGTSLGAAAAVWAAAEAADQVKSIVLIGPFVRDLPTPAFLRAVMKILFTRPWGPAAWSSYYKSLYPSKPPADLPEYRKALKRNLKERGRFEATRAMIWATKADCEARIPEVGARTLVVMGKRDPDFKDPAVEAQHVAGALRGQVVMIDEAGHYPHVEQPDATAPAIVSFLKG
jgi:pimeloyl-ACP methyl ester carboxylesterase